VFSKELGKKPSTVAVFYMFISNMLTSFGSLTGAPADGSGACWFEGIVTNIFTLSSVLWTAVLTLMLYSLLVSKHPMKVTLLTHAICWGIPLLATFLPFIDSTYGSPGGAEDWCWVVTTDDAPAWVPVLWYWLSFYAWLWLAFATTIVTFCLIILEFKKILPTTRATFLSIFNKLSGYPIIILACWLGSSVSDFYEYTDPNFGLDDGPNALITAMDCSMGLLSALYFWYHDSSLREKWVLLYHVGFNMKEYELVVKTRRSSMMTNGHVTVQPDCTTTPVGAAESIKLRRTSTFLPVANNSSASSKNYSKVLPVENDGDVESKRLEMENAVTFLMAAADCEQQGTTAGDCSAVVVVDMKQFNSRSSGIASGKARCWEIGDPIQTLEAAGDEG
jgi:hypothetical protein